MPLKPLIVLLLFHGFAVGQQSPSLSSSEILLGIQKLNTVGSVLYIAAHPDDENTRLLSYLANERKLRTGYLSITRGDGGQNLIGKEQGELLGVIRTQELLAARKKDGAEQFFTRANDFGYSKNPEETFEIWNSDSVLADMVWVIRKFRPDVIICRFPTTGEGGHGHHTASAILAEEAFDAAADPKRFPNQLKYVSTWQTKRLFWNTFNFGGNNTTSSDQLKIDVGVYNPLLGKGYGEIASESRSMHKSQGFGSAKTRGTTIEYFKQLKGETVTNDIFDSINQTWLRLHTGRKEKAIDFIVSQIHLALDDAEKKFDFLHPEKSADVLVKVYKLIQSLPTDNSNLDYWKKQKLKEAESLLLACSGLWMEAYVADPTGVPGTNISITAQFVNRNGTPAKLLKVQYPSSDTTAQMDLKPNQLYTFKRTEKLPENIPYSNPYWLNESHTNGLFTVKDLNLVGMPENIPQANIIFTVELAGQILELKRPLVYKFTDPVKGELYRPFEISPPVVLSLSQKTYLSVNGNPVKIKIHIKALRDSVFFSMPVENPRNWIVSATPGDSWTRMLAKKGDEAEVEFLLTPNSKATDSIVSVHLWDPNIGKMYSHGITRIEYDHIPYQFILSEAKAKLIKLDLKKQGNNIGYIPGAGDEIPACLEQIGYNVTELSNEMIEKGNLSQFDAIVTGVRAYNTNEKLAGYHPKLMEYVSKGGNLIVQYNTNSRVGPLNASIGPYPFTISRDRVTDENASVNFLRRAHPVLNGPNLITQKDFEGWVQERGIYFATKADEKYETIFAMNDKGEEPHPGSLIMAHYGKGNFVYTGLAFFRQLPAGVPGAYRLFVNLLSLPASK